MLKQLSVIAIALLATQANAAVGKPFVDVGFGQATFQDACETNTISDFDTAARLDSCDDKDTFFRLGAGVMLDPTFSAEMSYLNFGEATLTGRGFNRDIGRFIFNGSIEAQALALQLGAYAPLASNFNIYGKLGFAYTDIDLNVDANSVGQAGTASISDSDLEAIITAGAAYTLMPNVGVNFQVDFIPKAGTEETGESDLTAISLGLKYQF